MNNDPRERITTLMHDAAAQAAPDPLDLWPQIAERIRPQARRADWRISGMLTAAAATLIVIALAALGVVMRTGDGGSLTVAGLQAVTPTISPPPAGACTGTITAGNAPLYIRVPSDLEIPLQPLRRLPLNAEVMIGLQTEFAGQRWYFVESIQAGESLQGWIEAEAVQPLDNCEQRVQTLSAADACRSIGWGREPNTPVYAGPDANSYIVGLAQTDESGSDFYITGQYTDADHALWYQIQNRSNAYTGWIQPLQINIGWSCDFGVTGDPGPIPVIEQVETENCPYFAEAKAYNAPIYRTPFKTTPIMDADPITDRFVVTGQVVAGDGTLWHHVYHVARPISGWIRPAEFTLYTDCTQTEPRMPRTFNAAHNLRAGEAQTITLDYASAQIVSFKTPETEPVRLTITIDSRLTPERAASSLYLPLPEIVVLAPDGETITSFQPGRTQRLEIEFMPPADGEQFLVFKPLDAAAPVERDPITLGVSVQPGGAFSLETSN